MIEVLFLVFSQFLIVSFIGLLYQRNKRNNRKWKSIVSSDEMISSSASNFKDDFIYPGVIQITDIKDVLYTVDLESLQKMSMHNLSDISNGESKNCATIPIHQTHYEVINLVQVYEE